MLVLKSDYRLGGVPHHYIGEEKEVLIQIPDEVRKSVVFICLKPKKEPQKILAVGTAFLVTVELKEFHYHFGYIVTAKHVIDGIKSASVDDKVYLRVNKIDGTSVVLASTDIDAWKFHPSDPEHVDVAVLNAWIPQDTYDVRSILADMALTSEIIKNEQIGVGDEVFIPGLFVNHVGRQQNLPIVRTGAIARMPSEPIRTRYLGDIEAYLIEARSIGGISGSPVFVYMGHIRNRGGNMQIGGEQIMYYWLGLMHGHYDIEENKSDVIIEDGNNGTSVNMGIAIVVPVSKILEIINQDEFMKVRKQKEEELKNKNTPTPDMAMEEITKEQFEETLKKVSQKINPSELDSSKSKT